MFIHADLSNTHETGACWFHDLVKLGKPTSAFTKCTNSKQIELNLVCGGFRVKCYYFCTSCTARNFLEIRFCMSENNLCQKLA